MADHTPEQKAEMYGKDAADLLARWDAGDSPIHTVEMGGLGPGYEQALQITAFEILRDLLTRKPDHSLWADEDAWKAERDIIDKNVSKIIDSLGLSGAQWGAAMSLATAWYMRGPVQVMSEVDDNRRTMVSKNFPALKSAG